MSNRSYLETCVAYLKNMQGAVSFIYNNHPSEWVNINNNFVGEAGEVGFCGPKYFSMNEATYWQLVKDWEDYHEVREYMRKLCE